MSRLSYIATYIFTLGPTPLHEGPRTPPSSLLRHSMPILTLSPHSQQHLPPFPAHFAPATTEKTSSTQGMESTHGPERSDPLRSGFSARAGEPMGGGFVCQESPGKKEDASLPGNEEGKMPGEKETHLLVYQLDTKGRVCKQAVMTVTRK